jgi:hypothetical protein
MASEIRPESSLNFATFTSRLQAPATNQRHLCCPGTPKSADMATPQVEHPTKANRRPW